MHATQTEYWFITGTSSGLGKALAEHLLTFPQTQVTGISRSQTVYHDRYTHITADLSDAKSTASIQFNSISSPKKIFLVNNAGALGDMQYVGNSENEIMERTYHLNIIAPHLLCNLFIKTFRLAACEKGIINITSGAAKTAYDGWSLYCSTKAAMDMMSLCIFMEQKKVDEHIRFSVLSIAPGVMDTAMQQQIRSVEEGQFSRKNKFVDLQKNGQLYDANIVANRIKIMAENTTNSSEVVQRVII